MVHHDVGALRAVLLGNGRLRPGEHAVVLVPCVVEQHVAHGLDAHGHLHDVVLDELEAADLLALDDALVGIAAGVLIGAQGLAIGVERVDEPLVVEALAGGHQAVALEGEHIGLVDLHIVEPDVVDVLHVQAHLLHGLLLAVGHVGGHKPQGELLRVVRVLGQGQAVVAVLRAGDEVLVAVDVHLAVAAGVGGGDGRRGQVGARVGLGEALGEGGLALKEQGHKLVDLLLGAVLQQGVGLHVVPEQVDGSAAAAQGLHDQEHGDGALAVASGLLGQEHAEQAQLVQDIPPLLGVLVVFVAVLEVGLQVLTVHGVLNGLYHQFLLFCRSEIHTRVPP